MNDVDVCWKLVVDAAHQRIRRLGVVEIEVRHLRERMDAGIGAPQAVKLELVSARRSSDGALDLSVHGSSIFLHLPAAVPRAGILNRQFEAHSSRLPIRSSQLKGEFANLQTSVSTPKGALLGIGSWEVDPVSLVLASPHFLEYLPELAQLFAIRRPITVPLCCDGPLVVRSCLCPQSSEVRR